MAQRKTKHDNRLIFPHKLTNWDWRRWFKYSDDARKLDTALSCCSCKIRGWYVQCNCELEDEQRWLEDFLYVRKFQPPCVRAVTKDGAFVSHPLGFIMGPHTYKEWLTYCFDLFDLCHEVAEGKKQPLWSEVFFRHNDDFCGGHFKYFYPLSIIMINAMSGLENKHGAANDATRGVDLFETLQPKALNLSDVLRKQGHMITCPLPHFEFVQDIHRLNPDDIEAEKISNKIKKRNLRYKSRVKQMRKANKKLDWKNAMHYIPSRKQNFKIWYPKIKNVPLWFDFKTKKWQLPFFYTDKRIEDSQQALFNKTIEKWLASGAIYIMTPEEDVDLITPCVLANVQLPNGPPPEPGKKPRLCHDGGYEKNIEKYSFPCKLDDLRVVLKMTLANDLVTISDDQRGFHQTYLARESRKLTAFSYKDQIFTYRVAPFGSPKIPSIFQRANTIPVNYSRMLGARVALYLDDRMTFDQPEDVKDGVGLSSFLTSCMSICAGGFISLEKSDFEPKHTQQFLGLILDAKTGTISVPEEKWERFKETITLYLSQNFCTFKQLEKLRGKAVSFLLTNPMTKLFIRQMNSIIARMNKAGSKPNTIIKFGPKLRNELEEWIKLDHLKMSHTWANVFDAEKPPHRVTFTDASSFSAAALVFDGNTEAWHYQQMFEEEDQPKPIYFKEAKAILWMLYEFEEELSQKIILHFCDNESVVYSYNKLGSKVENMNDVIHQIYQKLHDMQSTMKMYWISTKFQLADAKSRTIEWNEEYWPKMFFHRFCRKWKIFPKVDAMATLANTKCTQYITLGKDSDPRCIGYDFFSYDPVKLKGIPFYIFPPKNVVFNTAQHLWKYYMKHEWIFIFHSFGELPATIAPLLKHVQKVNLDTPSSIVPAEKQLKVGDELHWGFWNRKPAQTIALIHKI